MTTAMRPLMLVALVLGAALAAATPTQLHGTGRISCEFTAPLVPGTGCDPFEPGEQHVLPRATRSYVELTVQWTPVSSSAERLQVDVFGNGACQDVEGPGCMRAVAIGTSPLTVRLDGLATQDTPVWGGVGIAPACTAQGCDGVPVRVVMDQPYSFTWTFE